MVEQVVIVGLAAWRLSHLLIEEDGPGAVLARFRRFIGVPVEGEVKGLLPELFTCPWCLTFWTAIAMWDLYCIQWVIPAVIAAMAVAMGAERLIGSDG